MLQIYIRDLQWRNILTWYISYTSHVPNFSFAYAKLKQILFNYAFLFPRKTSSSTIDKVEFWTIKAQPGSTRNNLDIKNEHCSCVVSIMAYARKIVSSQGLLTHDFNTSFKYKISATSFKPWLLCYLKRDTNKSSNNDSNNMQLQFCKF